MKAGNKQAQQNISEGKAGGKWKSRNENDPHLCLECGKELARGRLSYKKRHWEQAHKGDKTDIYKKMIVPINHEKAKSLLKERASKNRPSTSQSGCQDILDTDDVTLTVREENSDSHSEPDDEECSEQHSSLIEPMDLDNDSTPVNTTCPSIMLDELATSTTGSTTTTTSSSSSTVGKPSMQSTLSTFILPKENHPVSLEQIQSGINHLLVKMESFTLKENYVESDMLELSSSDTSQFKSTKNLLEVDHHDIKVETTSDGCRIICNPCNEYALDKINTKV